MAMALPVLVPETSAVRRASPESVSGWRKQQKAEDDSGLNHTHLRILLPLNRCELCTICIGPDYYEQELFLYPVYRESVCCGDSREYFHDLTYLRICGGCARASSRHLPSYYQVIKPEYWLTTELLTSAGETPRAVDSTDTQERKALATAIKQQFLQGLMFLRHFHLFVFALVHHIPRTLIFRKRGAPVAAVPYLTLLPALALLDTPSRAEEEQAFLTRLCKPPEMRLFG